MKTCSRCGAEKEATLEFFAPQRGALKANCRTCDTSFTRAWRAANPERRRATTAAHREANREALRAYEAAYRAANAEAIAASKAVWAAANPDKVLAIARKWRQENPERVAFFEAAYRASHPWKGRERAARRRARMAASPVVEKIAHKDIWERDKGRCHICGKKADPNDWHLDHIMPIALGGEHSHRNVAVSHPDCNRRKAAKALGQPRLMSV